MAIQKEELPETVGELEWEWRDIIEEFLFFSQFYH